MKKDIFEKKLKALEKYATDMQFLPEMKTSKNGNYYIQASNEKAHHLWSSYNVTKSTIGKIGTAFSYPVRHKVIMLTKTGKFLTNDSGKFKDIGVKRYKELWFIGRKCEWLLEYDLLQAFRLPRQFYNLNEFKKWLGYEFISDEKFREYMQNQLFIQIVIHFKTKTKEERINLISLLSESTANEINDTINMSQQLREDFILPKSKNRLKEIHDNFAKRIEIKDVNVEVKLENFVIPYEYSIITNSRQLLKRGQDNHHCIGSYYLKLRHDLFLNIDKYDAHIQFTGKHWEIAQIRGFANCEAPIELINIVNIALKDCNIIIKEIEPQVEEGETLELPF